MTFALVALDEQLACGLAALDVGLSPGSIGQRVDFVDGDDKLAALDHVEELVGVLFEGCAVGDVAVDDGTHEADVLGAEAEDGHGVDGARLHIRG